MSVLSACRICASSKLEDVVDLGSQHLASRFPKLSEQQQVPVGPVVLCMCTDCSLVQLKHTLSGSDMYEHEYGYRSGISNTMRQHLHDFNLEIQHNFETVAGRQLNSSDTVLDIGSNDTTFLRNYPEEVSKVGCDPTGKQFQEFYKQDIRLFPTYFCREAIPEDIKFSIVTSISMFYDLPDPVQFARDVYDVLTQDGIWVFEQSYALMMINQNSLDTICHEHLEYYNLKNIQDICKAAGFTIFDVKFNDCNGGSMRVYAHKSSVTSCELPKFDMQPLLQQEQHLYLPDTYKQWIQACADEIAKTKQFLETCSKNNQTCYIYGASTKGNTLLQYAGLTREHLKYAVERNLTKVGKFTPGNNIPIISEEKMRSDPPYAMLVLPWHFKEEILVREAQYLDQGGIMIFPLPHFEIVQKKS
jgi:hypothetical protein